MSIYNTAEGTGAAGGYVQNSGNAFYSSGTAVSPSSFTISPSSFISSPSYIYDAASGQWIIHPSQYGQAGEGAFQSGHSHTFNYNNFIFPELINITKEQMMILITKMKEEINKGCFENAYNLLERIHNFIMNMVPIDDLIMKELPKPKEEKYFDEKLFKLEEQNE